MESGLVFVHGVEDGVTVGVGDGKRVFFIFLDHDEISILKFAIS